MTAGSADDQLFGAVFETSPVGIVITDADGQILDANSRAETVLGLSHDELTDRSYDDDAWKPVRDDGTPMPTDESPVSKVLETGEAVFGIEHGIEKPDGDILWLSVNAAPIYDDGSIDRIVATISEISDRWEYRRMLEQQNRRLEEYSAIVSHDLRSPLSVASGWLNVAIEDDSTEDLDKVRDALDRMGDLITDLRELGRHGQTVDEMVELDLQTVVETAWSNVSMADATLDLEPDIGSVAADRSRLLQLFENLFRNAVEHAGPDVTIRVGALPDGFYVEDDGPGIPADKRDSVFEFGYSTTEHGTGIGLAIVEAVADAHGWSFELVDADPHGARFEFRQQWYPDRVE